MEKTEMVEIPVSPEFYKKVKAIADMLDITPDELVSLAIKVRHGKCDTAC